VLRCGLVSVVKGKVGAILAPETMPGSSSNRSPADVAFQGNVDSGSEKCGFVVHVLVVLTTSVYAGFLLHSQLVSQHDTTPTWTLMVPVTIACLFVATLISLFVIVVFSVSSRPDAAETTSCCTTIDKKHVLPAEAAEAIGDDEISNIICDLDVAVINDKLVKMLSVQ